MRDSGSLLGYDSNPRCHLGKLAVNWLEDVSAE